MAMNKSLIVAQSEFATLVRSKAFLIGIVLMPVIMIASILLMKTTRTAGDGKPRKFAYVDYTGVVGEQLRQSAAAWNAAAAANPGTTPTFFPEAVSIEGTTPDTLRLELSERVRKQDLFAFVEIPRDVLDPEAKAEVRYYSDHPSYQPLPQFLRTSINQAILNERFRAASMDRSVVTRLTRQAPVSNLGLFERDDAGGVKPAEKVDDLRAFAIPGVLMVIMYITIMTSAPQLLNTVIEEKMSRISEVLIASVTPFELMLGKLLGSVAVAVLLALIYIAGAVGVATYWGYSGVLTASLAFWFLLFLVMGVLMFGSVFIAVGAACNDLKDSQGMMMPVMLLIMVPVMTWGAVLRAPDGMMALVLSLFPTTAPFLMLLRVSIQPGPPLWQVGLSVAIMAATVVLFVWAAGRIFRTGLLMQGKSPTMAEMIRWVRAG